MSANLSINNNGYIGSLFNMLRENNRLALKKNAPLEVMTVINFLKDNLKDEKYQIDIFQLNYHLSKKSFKKHSLDKSFEGFKSKICFQVYEIHGIQGVLNEDLFVEYYKEFKKNFSSYDRFNFYEAAKDIAPIYDATKNYAIDENYTPINQETIEIIEDIKKVQNIQENLPLKGQDCEYFINKFKLIDYKDNVNYEDIDDELKDLKDEYQEWMVISDKTLDKLSREELEELSCLNNEDIAERALIEVNKLSNSDSDALNRVFGNSNNNNDDLSDKKNNHKYK